MSGVSSVPTFKIFKIFLRYSGSSMFWLYIYLHTSFRLFLLISRYFSFLIVSYVMFFLAYARFNFNYFITSVTSYSRICPNFYKLSICSFLLLPSLVLFSTFIPLSFSLPISVSFTVLPSFVYCICCWFFNFLKYYLRILIILLFITLYYFICFNCNFNKVHSATVEGKQIEQVHALKIS